MNYGIVAEFNPFHNGHKFLVDSVKKTEDDTAIAVMSGSFVQRGECAVAPVSHRVRMALLNGVDLVISLPVQYATSSAQRFAQCGVKLLESTGVVDCIAFGSECGDKKKLTACAEAVLSSETDEKIKEYLTSGCSFPVARQRAVADCFGEEIASVLSEPNDILGVEYTSAVIYNKYESDIFPVKRTGAEHDSSELKGNICSASMVRSLMKNKEHYDTFLPQATAAVLKECTDSFFAPADLKKAEKAILYKLRTMSAEDFSLLPDVSEGLEYRLFDAVKTSLSVDEILEKAKTKRYTHSRLRRVILCAALGITKEDIKTPVPYIRVLGFNKKGSELLKKMKDTASLPVVSKYSEIKALGENAESFFLKECAARDFFSLCLPRVGPCGEEMTEKIVVV